MIRSTLVLLAALALAASTPVAVADPALSEGVRMTVSGQVKTKDGKPQPGVTVRFSCTPTAADAEPAGGASDPTDANGEFRVTGVPAGKCLFVVWAPWGLCVPPGSPGNDPCGGPTSAYLTIQEGANVTDFSLMSPPPHPAREPWGVVAGTFVDPSGVSDDMLSIVCGACIYGPSPSAPCTITSGPIRLDGTFTLELPVGPCRIRACALTEETCKPDLTTPCAVGEPCADVNVSEGAPVEGLVLQPVLTVAQTSNGPEDVFEFPIKPGDADWNLLPRPEEKAAFQLPDSVRRSISTAGLLETCLRYPGLFLVASARSDLKRRSVVSAYEHHFNGFTELLSRPDTPRVILARYLRSDEDHHTTKEMLEYLLRDPRVLPHLSKAEVLTLLCECVRRAGPGPGRTTPATVLLAEDLLGRFAPLFGKSIVVCEPSWSCKPEQVFGLARAALAEADHRCE